MLLAVRPGPMIEQMRALGYRSIDFAPSAHGRQAHSHFYKLEKDGRFYFAKYFPDRQRHHDSVATELWWYQTIRQLAPHAGFQLRAPAVVASGEDWYVAQWLEASAVLEPTAPAPQLGPRAADLVRLLLYFDAVDVRSLSASPHSSPLPLPDQLTVHWAAWSEQPIATGLMGHHQLVRAYDLIRQYQTYLTPRLQHGDFTPWHVLIDSEGAYWPIDGERAGQTKPRYYDLAYCYSRLFTKLHSPATAARLLQTFQTAASISLHDLYPALIPVMTSRAIGMQFDALNDCGKNDYRPEAKELLRRCLSDQPESLFAPSSTQSTG